MPRLRSSLVWAGTVSVLVAACSSDDSSSSKPKDGTLVAFQGSACKKESGQALTAQDAYAGLSCVRWKPGSSSGSLKIDLTNFEGACGAEWKGQATEVDGALELRSVNPSCSLAGCGSCMYDWSFEVKVDTQKDLPLSLVTDPCPGDQPPETQTTTLPLSSTPQGELCRYASTGGLSWQAGSLGTCGQAYMPCRSPNGMCQPAGSEPPCDAGLTCADAAKAGDQVCHATCKADGDCTIAGILTCQAGLCKPAKPW